jgi:hypothetical protein
MSAFGFLDSGGEVALAVGLLVLFAVLGFAWVMGWLDIEKPRVELLAPNGGGIIEIEEGEMADLLRAEGYIEVVTREAL